MDEVEIANLVYSYADYIDSGDLVTAAELFSHARIKLYQDGELLSHDELLAVWRKAIIIYPDGTPKTKHVITNPIIKINSDDDTATCRSYYTVTQSMDSLPLQVIAAGRYHDEFVRANGRWQFSYRDYSLLDAVGDLSGHVRNHSGSTTTSKVDPSPKERGDDTSPTKAKILMAAQDAFSTMGYSESGIRKIADRVGLSSALVNRHFGSKAALFETALITALDKPTFPERKDQFGRFLADKLATPGAYLSSHSMTLLAVGNEEARAIVVRVLQERGVSPLAEWLGPPDAESRARQILALCAGFVLYNSQLTCAEGSDPLMVEWLAQGLQAVVDQS